ncbi:MAG: flagellar basal body P-ring formation chaperone FlgA [Acidobacteriota bacterium]
MSRVRTAILALTTVCSLGAFLWGRTLRIPDRVEVCADILVLQDLCGEALPETLGSVSLGYAPYPGHYRWISRAELKRALRNQGLDEGLHLQMNDRILLTRKNRILESKEVHEAVQAYLSRLCPGFEIEILHLTLPQGLTALPGRIRIQVDEKARLSRLDNAPLKLDVVSEGRSRRSHWVRLKARAKGRVAILKRDIRWGQPISDSDVELETREVDALEGFFQDPSHVQDMVAKRDLRAGAVLHRDDVRKPLLVDRGDIVKLLARGTAFVLETAAKARDAGARGDVVTVQNLDSKQLVKARVTRPGTVEIDLHRGTR